MRNRSLLLLAALIAGAAGAGGDPGLAALEVARANWNAEGPRAYSYVLERGCFCSAAATQPIKVTVRDGSVVDFEGQGGLAVPEDMREVLRTMPKWFDYIGRSHSQGWHSVEVEYHERRGYPTTIEIDRREWVADDEDQWTFSDFTALSP